jgi:hypothetical protein
MNDMAPFLLCFALSICEKQDLTFPPMVAKTGLNIHVKSKDVNGN